MLLQAIKPFTGLVEGKPFDVGDTLNVSDVERLNTLIGRGYCKIVAIDDVVAPAPKTRHKKGEKKQEY